MNTPDDPTLEVMTTMNQATSAAPASGASTLTPVSPTRVDGAFARSIGAKAACDPPCASSTCRIGTPLEAIRLVKQAIAYLHAHGKEQVLAAINTPNGPFRLHDLYVTVLDLNGKSLAHAADDSVVGQDVLDQCDIDGKPFVRERLHIAHTQGSGWQRFKYRNPAKNNVIEAKAMYVERVGDWIFGCGIYTEQ